MYWLIRNMAFAFFGTFMIASSIHGELNEKKNELNMAMHLLLENSFAKAPYKIRYDGRNFVVYPGVFSPKQFPDSFWFAKHLVVEPGKTFLEIGSGTGLISVMAAIQGAAQVTAVDINHAAVSNTFENAMLNQVSRKMRVYEGDVFDPIPAGQRFDVIFWFAPFMHINLEKSNLTDLEKSIFDPGYQSITKYIREARNYLNLRGRLYLGFSPTHGDLKVLSQIANENGWRLEVVAQEEMHVPIISGLDEIDPITVMLLELKPKMVQTTRRM